MSTVRQYLWPEQAQFKTTEFPLYVRNVGTNFSLSGLSYEGVSTDNNAYWKFIASNYGSGNITATIYWYADTATSGNVVWGAQLAAVTSNTDTQDVETKALATANTFQDAHLGTTGQRVHSADITISNLDSLANGDIVFINIFRDASDTTNDTMAGYAILLGVMLAYSDV